MGFASPLRLPPRPRPAISAASSSMMGAIILQGPHHAAHASTRTGTGERSTSAENVASVTVTGRVSMDTGRGVLQRPHTGSSPLSTLSRGTRLATPQAGHRITSVSDTAVAPPGDASRLPEPLAKELLRMGEAEGSPLQLPVRGPTRKRHNYSSGLVSCLETLSGGPCRLVTS